uniref:Uncharacterized protein n=1 Tax=Ananas comosus var. bracteatus TaxID=296719 RepID=A0A6V7NP94_ANACO|nr:unnamed protein product [Ananas comosus var. bracteatus]
MVVHSPSVSVPLAASGPTILDVTAGEARQEREAFKESGVKKRPGGSSGDSLVSRSPRSIGALYEPKKSSALKVHCNGVRESKWCKKLHLADLLSGTGPWREGRFPNVVCASLLSGTGPRREGPVAPRRRVRSAGQPVQVGQDRSSTVEFAQTGWVVSEELENLKIMLSCGLRVEICRATLRGSCTILGHTACTGTCMVSGVRTTEKFPVGSAADPADSPTRSIQAYVGKRTNHLVNCNSQLNPWRALSCLPTGSSAGQIL